MGCYSNKDQNNWSWPWSGWERKEGDKLGINFPVLGSKEGILEQYIWEAIWRWKWQIPFWAYYEAPVEQERKFYPQTKKCYRKSKSHLILLQPISSSTLSINLITFLQSCLLEEVIFKMVRVSGESQQWELSSKPCKEWNLQISWIEGA